MIDDKLFDEISERIKEDMKKAMAEQFELALRDYIFSSSPFDTNDEVFNANSYSVLRGKRL